jgi:outer membrane protein assembly factor BamB
MGSALLALAALALAVAPEDTGRLSPAPLRAWDVAWMKALVESDVLEWHPDELGGPAVDPVTRAVFAGTRNGLLRAFLPGGEPLWEFQAGAGFAAAPLVHDGVVYAGSLDGRLYALTAATGKERWRYSSGEEVGSAPLLAEGLAVFATLQDSVVAVDATSGAWRWHHRRDRREGFTVRGAARPVSARGLFFVGWSDGFVSALEPATGAVQWERKVAPGTELIDVDGLAADAHRLYAACFSGVVAALDPSNGKTLWERKEPGAARLLLADGRLYAVGSQAVVALEPEGGGRLWRHAYSGGGPTGAPVRTGSRLAVPTGRSLLLLDPGSGRLVRSLDPGSGVSAPPAWLGRRAYVLSNAGVLLALDLP